MSDRAEAKEKTKRCSLCKTHLPFSEFHKHPIQGLQSHCKGCRSKEMKEWYRANAERNSVRSKNYYLAHKEQYLRKGQECYLNNKLAVYLQHKAWIENNRERARLMWNRAKKRKQYAAGYCSKESYAGRWDYYGGRCWICSEEATEMDHVIPLSVRAIAWPANRRPICRTCNRRKSDKGPLQGKGIRKSILAHPGTVLPENT